MADEVLEQPAKPVVKKPAEPLLSKRRKRIVADPLNEDNPITVQVLGICSALAVTVKLEPTLIIGISVVAVMSLADLVISMICNLVPNRMRNLVHLPGVATLVILVE